MTLTLDIIEARAKALGWPTSHTSNAFDGPCLRVETPSGYVVYGVDIDGETCIFNRETDLSPCRHDLAALESPEPARPAPDPVTGLLPCPFCGGKAVFIRDHIWSHTVTSARCEDSGCAETQELSSESYARDAWNRRTP